MENPLMHMPYAHSDAPVRSLIVFPGSGSPDNDKYREVYQLINNEANNYGYKDIDISLRWPGHINSSSPSSEILTLQGVVNSALTRLRQHEIENKRYSLLGRSFGTIVGCYCAVTDELKGLEKLILWGPSPYWLFWEMFVKDLLSTESPVWKEGIC